MLLYATNLFVAFENMEAYVPERKHEHPRAGQTCCLGLSGLEYIFKYKYNGQSISTVFSL